MCIISNCIAAKLTSWSRHKRTFHYEDAGLNSALTESNHFRGAVLGGSPHLDSPNYFLQQCTLTSVGLKYACTSWWTGMSFSPCLSGLARWDLCQAPRRFYWHIGRSLSASRASEIPPDVNSLFGQDATSLYSGSEVPDATQIVCLHLFWLPLKALCSFWALLLTRPKEGRI